MTTIVLVAVTALLSGVLVGFVRSYAVHNDVLDHPNARSSHTTPTPRGGGLGVLVAALLALGAGVALHRIQTRHAIALAPGMLALGIVGWLDDHASLSPRVRLGVHLLAAASALAILGGVPDVQLGATSLHVGMLGTALAAIGIVWSINLFNFMDGIDGIAASQALLVFGIGGLLFLTRGDTSLATTALCFAGASAGFLYWNWPPARIFMGDVASGALGFMIAVLAVAGEHDRSVPIVPMLILGGAFAGDATVTLLRRIRAGAPPADAHRDHAYQRLARAWGAHRPVTLATAALTLLLGVLAALAVQIPAFTIGAVATAALLLAIVFLLVERRAPLRLRVSRKATATSDHRS